MRTKGTLFKFVFLLGLCAFLLGMPGADAAGKPDKPTPANVGSLDEAKLSPVGFSEAYCESGCCWASGEHVVCSESGCYAEGGGESAEYICDQN